MNIQGWFPLGLTGLISLLSRGLPRVFSSTTNQKHQFFSSAFFTVHLSHPYIATGKTRALTIRAFVSKVMSLLFIMLSRFVIAFHPRSKYLLILWLLSPSAVILEPKKIKSVSVSTFAPFLPWSDGNRCYDLRFLNIEFKSAFSLSSFNIIKRLFSSSLLSAIKVVSSAYASEVVDISPSNLDFSLWCIWPSILHDVLCI